MAESNQIDTLLIERIREGDKDAWNDLIARFEGRLLAFVRGRVNSLMAAEDVVQETFIGLLTSLPNFDSRRPLESYLFSIASHKLTDLLRREGRRPTVPLTPNSNRPSVWEPMADVRAPSSIARSSERRHIEESALVEGMQRQVSRWQKKSDWQRIHCMELLIVCGWSNKDVASQLDIAEQTVANYKFQFLTALRNAIKKQELSEDVFPELYEESPDEK